MCRERTSAYCVAGASLWEYRCGMVCMCAKPVSDLPAVEFESQSQLFVVDNSVSSHVLLGPDTV